MQRQTEWEAMRKKENKEWVNKKATDKGYNKRVLKTGYNDMIYKKHVQWTDKGETKHCVDKVQRIKNCTGYRGGVIYVYTLYSM